MSEAIVAFGNAAKEPLENVLLEVLGASGRAAAKALRGQLRAASGRFRSAEDIDFAFDVTNPEAVAWAKRRAAELITDLSETNRRAIRELVEDAFEDQYDVDQLADEIAEIIGDDDRADLIARTETMRASNEGQLQAWNQARDAGFLTGTESKEWIATDELCPICVALDGETVGLTERFNVEGDSIDGPPAHPNCRCTVGLTTAE